jgi:hypothetical protein
MYSIAMRERESSKNGVHRTFSLLNFYLPATSVADPGCLFRIPDPTFFHPGSELSPSRILIKEFKYFNPKKSKKMVPKL